ncbi:MAG TPA: VWA domain-containing protein [Spirochaetota bacterium]|nr:VWA domain-containing protein [Spirochaetota bacterium]
MKKKLLILLLFVNSIIFSTSLIYDDLTIDANGTLSLKIHNLTNEEGANINLFLDEKKTSDFIGEKIKSPRLFGIIIDNSGSMALEDFFTILRRVNYLLTNLEKDDYLIVWKLNNSKEIIYPFSIPNESLSGRISNLIREGKFTRLFDGISEAQKEIYDISNKAEFKNRDSYLLVFSDGDDIGSFKNREDILSKKYNIPFYFFSYPNKDRDDIIAPYKKLSDFTKGKVLERPSDDDINNFFIERLNKYVIKFKIDKNEITKKKEYFAKITAKDKFLKFDLRKLFDENNLINIKKIDIIDNEGFQESINSLDKEDASKGDASSDKDEKNIFSDKNADNTKDVFSDQSGDGERSIVNLDASNDGEDRLENNKNFGNKKGVINFLKFNYKLLFIILAILAFLIIILVLRKIIPIFAGKSESNEEGGYSPGSVKNDKKNRILNANISSDYNSKKDILDDKKTKKDKNKKDRNRSEEEKAFVERKKEELKEVFENNLDKKKDKSYVASEVPGEEGRSNLDDKNAEKIDDSDKKDSNNETGIEENLKDVSENFYKNGNVVFVREKEDLNDYKKYSKISLFHNEKTSYIDEAERFGEELSLTSNFKIKEVSKNIIVCTSEYPMLLDEIVEIEKIKLISSKISYNEKKKEFKITFIPKKKTDLSKIFKEKQDISANKKSRIFGNKDALIEKSLSSKKEFEREKTTNWKSAEIIYKKNKEAVLITEFQICVDTIVEIREENESEPLSYFVSKITKIEENKFKNKLFFLKSK